MVDIQTYDAKKNQYLINASMAYLVFDELFPAEMKYIEMPIKCY